MNTIKYKYIIINTFYINFLIAFLLKLYVKSIIILTNTQDTTQDTTHDVDKRFDDIIEFCTIPRSRQEIQDFIGLKTLRNNGYIERIGARKDGKCIVRI